MSYRWQERGNLLPHDVREEKEGPRQTVAFARRHPSGRAASPRPWPPASVGSIRDSHYSSLL